MLSLYHDLETVLEYLSERLPEELVSSLSSCMMSDLIPRIITSWLEPAVPASLKDMDGFQSVIDATEAFCRRIKTLGFSRFEELQEWAETVPRVWLAKCRETALESIRIKLTKGLGESKEIERIETQTVSQEEGQRLYLKRSVPVNGDGWDAAWDDNDDTVKKENQPKQAKNEDGGDNGGDDGADAWGWGDEGDDNERTNTIADTNPKQTSSAEDDDPTAAWGWGDEDAAADTATEDAVANPSTQELTLKETYNISAMPEPVTALILAVLEDGAYLVRYVLQ